MGTRSELRRRACLGGGSLLIAAVCAVALVLPASAMASSVVFVKPDGNVWLAGPDGTEQVRVTGDGSAAKPYYSPSQSASGTIEVARGVGAAGRIYRLDPSGRRLSAPFAAAQAPVISDPVLSADGRKVALWTLSLADVAAPCYTNFYCFEVSTAGRFNQLTRPAWMTFEHPAWMGSSRLLLFNGDGTLNYADLRGYRYRPWFSWLDYHTVAADGLGEWLEGAASRNGKALALLAHLDRLRRYVIEAFSGPADTRSADLSSYRPTRSRCTLTAPDGGSGAEPGRPGVPALANLSFSPGGTALAYEFRGAIYVAALSSCTTRKIIARGRDPFWGPASVPEPTITVSVPANAGVGALLRGLRVKVTLSTPGTITLRLLEGTSTLASVRATLPAGRAKTVVLTPGSKVARRLRGSTRLRATLTASLAGFRRPLQSTPLTLGP